MWYVSSISDSLKTVLRSVLIYGTIILGVDHLIYPALKRLKDLRNRVHLQKTEGNTDHDYNAFDYSVKNEMSEILHDILTSPKITDRPETFNFIKSE